MNTQRPEWNDANNALVGNGTSMVTLCYLHRFMKFFQDLLDRSEFENVKISSELLEFYHSIREGLQEFEVLVEKGIDDEQRKVVLDRFGKSASDYRQQIYSSGFWGKKRSASLGGLKTFAKYSLLFLEHTIRENQRKDKLFHAYNIITVGKSVISCNRLDEMLEGQVAVLSSGLLNSKESLEVLDALKASKLFRSDQYSYILYPNKDLPGFLQKNIISKDDVASSELITKLVKNGNTQIVEMDINGDFHFSGNFKNANDLAIALDLLPNKYSNLVEAERELILEIFEKVFNHKAFTGRSGTFFSYEGLGSIYWHMVSKLHLAVQECCLKATYENEDPKIIGQLYDHYYEIGAGIGVHKSPELYGAFPTDPYSHTPQHRGAQQPGMTGQVKEDILVRFGELGVFVNKGKIFFNPSLLRKVEFTTESKIFEYFDLRNEYQKLQIKPRMLAFTYCQVPVIYQLANERAIAIEYNVGKTVFINSHQLDKEISQEIFNRTGAVKKIIVSIPESITK
ncbi:MAG: hypothetical protein EOM23_04465 [Candidatus Moranbacteria bacterium]|nr:hypothetical protein [Candidatus Moranbacteria bacterium]